MKSLIHSYIKSLRLPQPIVLIDSNQKYFQCFQQLDDHDEFLPTVESNFDIIVENLKDPEKTYPFPMNIELETPINQLLLSTQWTNHIIKNQINNNQLEVASHYFSGFYKNNVFSWVNLGWTHICLLTENSLIPIDTQVSNFRPNSCDFVPTQGLGLYSQIPIQYKSISVTGPFSIIGLWSNQNFNLDLNLLNLKTSKREDPKFLLKNLIEKGDPDICNYVKIDFD